MQNIVAFKKIVEKSIKYLFSIKQTVAVTIPIQTFRLPPVYPCQHKSQASPMDLTEGMEEYGKLL